MRLLPQFLILLTIGAAAYVDGLMRAQPFQQGKNSQTLSSDQRLMLCPQAPRPLSFSELVPRSRGRTIKDLVPLVLARHSIAIC